jgi:phosphoglucosamine mutase
VVISASHNPYHDNGVKLISSAGTKFPDAVEAEIERFILSSNEPAEARSAMPLRDNEKIDDDYLDGLRAAVLPGANLAGMKIVMDCANGAASALAPRWTEHQRRVRIAASGSDAKTRGGKWSSDGRGV